MFDNFQIDHLGAKYYANNKNGIEDGELSYRFIEGKIPVLLSAPHAVRQIRNGMIKPADEYTGPIVEYLCKKTGACGVIRFANKGTDPNYSPDGMGKQYRDDVAEYCKAHEIGLLIDLHGKAGENFVAEIGTNYGKNLCGRSDLAEKLEEALKTLGVVNRDKKFCAKGECTVSRYVAAASGTPCIQVELSAAMRKHPGERKALLKVLTDYIKSVSEK